MAGLTTTTTFSLSRPESYGQWDVPTVNLTDDHLLFQPSPGSTVTGRAGLLESFIQLCHGSDSDIARFAAKWGALDICCKHNLPSSHLPFRHILALDLDEAPCTAMGLWSWRGAFLAAWRDYSGKARAILDIAAQLHIDPARSPSLDLWRPLHNFLPNGLVADVLGQALPDIQRFVAPPPQQAKLLGTVIDHWLALGDVQVSFTWDGRPHTSFGTGNLFGALGLQLALAVSRTDGLAICDACGHTFIPVRQRRAGSPTYCPECGPRASKRESARRRRAQERKTNTE